MEEKTKENIRELKKLKKTYCAWPNNCKNENKHYMCCNFCENKTCDSRCKDNCKTCIYLWTEDEHNEHHDDTNKLLIKKDDLNMNSDEKPKRRLRRSND